MEANQKVLVFTDEIVGWEVGELIERYSVIEKDILEKWRIETTSGTAIVRYVKDLMDFKSDGCGYILEKDKEVKAKVNFNTWDLGEWSESWDDPEYFGGLFSNRDEVYKFTWDGQEFFGLIGCDDEREGTLFEPNDLIITEV